MQQLITQDNCILYKDLIPSGFFLLGIYFLKFGLHFPPTIKKFHQQLDVDVLLLVHKFGNISLKHVDFKGFHCFLNFNFYLSFFLA